MERAPLEILEYIFSLACTDHGETGRALSGVSRYIRAASARYKHQSIVVRTPEHLKAFTQLLKRASPELRRVGSLVLSSQPACTFNTGAGKQTLYGVQKPALYPSCLRAEIAAPALLRVIAPTLRTLDLDLAAFSVLRRMHISAPSIIVFPALQELHIAGDGRSVGLRLGNFFHNFAFPVLLRLGVQGAFPDMDLRQLALAAPVLQECILVGWTVSLDLPLVFHPLITSDKTGKFPYRVILHVARPSPLTIAYVHALSVHEQVVGQLKALACASGNTLAIVQH